MAGKDNQAANQALPTGAALREQAEVRLRNTAALASEKPESMSPAAIARLLHELPVPIPLGSGASPATGKALRYYLLAIAPCQSHAPNSQFSNSRPAATCECAARANTI